MNSVISRPTFLSFLRYWIYFGFISFGNAAAHISILHQELVEEKKWISEKRFLHALNYCMLLPGPEAQQLATYIGWLLYGTWGGIIAGCLFILPSLFILIALSSIYLTYGHIPVITDFLYAIKPAVTAVILFTAWRMGQKIITNFFLGSIAISAFIAIFFFNISFPLIILVAGLIGYLSTFFTPTTPIEQQNNFVQYSLIDDNTQLPAHLQFRLSKFIRFLIIFISLWIIGILFLVTIFGWHSVFVNMAWFFTTAAFLTFGGAFAALPYFYQGAVIHYQWLTAAQMLDGLALREAIPGPMIMVVAFVGFVGGWTKMDMADENLFFAGLMGALIATFFTFLPSFLFILLGAPLIESTHGQIKWQKPLSAITSAVVGVILKLAFFFAYHVVFPPELNGGFDILAFIIGLCASIALFYYQIKIIWVILSAGLGGIMLGLWV